MKYLLFGQFWSAILLLLLIFIIYFLIKKLKGNRSKLPLLIILACLLSSSCKKTEQNTTNLGTSAQQSLVKDLGFDPDKVVFEKSPAETNILKFENRNDAILFFKYLKQVKPKLYWGKVTATLNKKFDPISYVRAIF